MSVIKTDFLGEKSIHYIIYQHNFHLDLEKIPKMTRDFFKA